MQGATMLDLSRDINSLSNFKRNTPEFIRQMKETGAPVVLTVNGKAEIVVQDAEAYQKLLEQVERLQAIEGIKRGLNDVEEGRTLPLAEFDAEMQKKYGITR
jgi:prevent-host-death family protein